MSQFSVHWVTRAQRSVLRQSERLSLSEGTQCFCRHAHHWIDVKSLRATHPVLRSQENSLLNVLQARQVASKFAIAIAQSIQTGEVGAHTSTTGINEGTVHPLHESYWYNYHGHARWRIDLLRA
jgi:hypothetical protein